MDAAAAAFETIRASRLLGEIDDAGAHALAPLLRPFAAAAGETLFTAGTPIDRVLFLRSGSVHIGEPVLATAAPGDTLGDLALNGPASHTATAVAECASHGYVLETATFDRLRVEADPLALTVLQRLSLLLASRIRAFSVEPSPTPAQATSGARRGPPAADDLVFLHSLPWFRAFARSDLEDFLGALRTWEVEPGARVLAEGSAQRSAFVVLRGSVEVTRERGDRRLRLATLG